MAETQTPQKRPREEKPQDGSGSELDDGSKRHKPYTNIINLLDDDDEGDEASQDLSAIFTTLQQELSSSDYLPSTAVAVEEEAELGLAAAGGVEDEGLKLPVMRHLLEASDDELGLPNRSTDEINSEIFGKSGENLWLGLSDDGLWELEYENANFIYIPSKFE